MKIILKITLLGICLITFSCSKDLGNYEYTDVNEIKITDGVLDGVHNTQRIYRVPFGDKFDLTPTYEGSVSGSDMTGIEFLWTIDGEIVSKTKDLHYVANVKFGKLPGVLKITDKATSLVKTYAFFVEVINGFKSGYYFLSQKANADAALYCIPTSLTDYTVKEVTIPRLEGLGKNPIYLDGYLRYGNGSSDYWNIIFLGVKNANYPVSVIESKEFFPYRVYNSSSYFWGSGFNFEPTQMRRQFGSSSGIEGAHVVVNGKLHHLGNGAISEVKFQNDTEDYFVASSGLFDINSANTYEHFVAFFDSKNQKVRLVASTSKVPFNFGDDYNVVQSSDQFVGHKFIYGTYYTASTTLTYTFLTTKDNKIYLFEGSINTTTRVAGKVTEIGTAVIPEGAEVNNVMFNSGQKSFYIAMGKTLYRMGNIPTNKILLLEDYIKLPVDAPGVLTNFTFGSVNIDARSTNYNSLLLTTTDYSASTDKKSSVFIYNSQDLKLVHSQKYAIEEVKGIFVGL